MDKQNQTNSTQNSDMKPNVCQSCGMPMNDGDFGTEKNGEKCLEYCKHCYQNGEFTFKGSLDDMVKMLTGMAADMGMTSEQAEEFGKKVLPELKRWKVEKECCMKDGKCEKCGMDCKECKCEECECDDKEENKKQE